MILAWGPMVSKNLFHKLDSRKIGLVISFFGILGSLYFSEILKYAPCVLCWYQRIALYPLAVIYGAALWSDDRSHFKYSLPFVTVGVLIAVYHNLLYFGVIVQAIVPCSEGGTSCTARQLELFGFLTIPLLSLISFLIIGIAEVVSLKMFRLKGGSFEK